MKEDAGIAMAAQAAATQAAAAAQAVAAKPKGLKYEEAKKVQVEQK